MQANPNHNRDEQKQEQENYDEEMNQQYSQIQKIHEQDLQNAEADVSVNHIDEDTQNNILSSEKVQKANNSTKESSVKSKKCNALMKLITIAIILILLSIAVPCYLKNNILIPIQSNPLDSLANASSITAIVAVTNFNETLIFQSLTNLATSLQNQTIAKIYILINHNITVGTLTKIAALALGQHLEYVFFQGVLTFKILDDVLSKVETIYYLYSNTQWQINDMNFIKHSRLVLEARPNIIQMMVDYSIEYGDKNQYERGRGFDFGPALHRTKDYQLLQGGLSGIAGPNCEINLYCQDLLSNYYFAKGYRILGQNLFNIKKYIQTYQIPQIQRVKDINNEQTQIQKKTDQSLTIKGHIKQLQGKLQDAPRIVGLNPEIKVHELPFCLLMIGDDDSIQFMRQSLTGLNYKNYYTLDIPQISTYSSIRSLLLQPTSPCPRNSILLFLTTQLLPSSLSYLNKLHQTSLTYCTFSKSTSYGVTSYEVYTVLWRVYMLIQDNDFYQLNKIYMDQYARWKWVAIGILELAAGHVIWADAKEIYWYQVRGMFWVSSDSTDREHYAYYDRLLLLSQDMKINVEQVQRQRESNPYKKQQKGVNLTQQQMQLAYQLEQLPYLPQNSTLQQIQLTRYQQLYNITPSSPSTPSSTPTPSSPASTRFCLTIPSHNNIQNKRYKKLLSSILQQQYTNYHIVFIDDNSSDGTLQKTMQYFQQLQQQKKDEDKIKIVYIENLQRKYATYNIVNAGFMYCGEDDVQVVIDGDDQLIGNYVLSTFDAVYRNNPNLWIVYSNYKSSLNQFGRSSPIKSPSDHLTPTGKRAFISNIGPVRSWKVKLLYSIPLHHHKMQNGHWLDTVYDDALQHPLIELASPNRSHYINQIMYNYNVRYGDNDDSSAQKTNHRIIVYKQVLALQVLSKLGSLEGVVKNKQVLEELERDRNVKYREKVKKNNNESINNN